MTVCRSPSMSTAIAFRWKAQASQDNKMFSILRIHRYAIFNVCSNRNEMNRGQQSKLLHRKSKWVSGGSMRLRTQVMEDAQMGAATMDITSQVPSEATGVQLAPDDPVVTALFTLATVALSVVTLGVGYLSILSWLDSRQESQDRVKGKSSFSSNTASKDDAPGGKKKGRGSSSKKKKAKDEEFKGFG